MFRLMLDAHPALAIPAETHFLARITALAGSPEQLRTTVPACIVHSNRWPDFHLQREEYLRLCQALDPFDAAQAVRIFYQRYAARFSKPRWGDKTPHYLACMEGIQALLPEARFIHLIRDGRDAALSITGLWWGPSTLPDAARWWVDQIETGRSQQAKLNHYLELRYEDLVLRPEATLRQVAAFIELPWDDAMLQYHLHARTRIEEYVSNHFSPKEGAFISGQQRQSYQKLVNQPPDPGRIGQWRTRMGPEEQRQFWAIAGHLLDPLGYSET